MLGDSNSPAYGKVFGRYYKINKSCITYPFLIALFLKHASLFNCGYNLFTMLDKNRKNPVPNTENDMQPP